MFCSHCGSSTEDSQNFCPHCGSSFEDLSDPHESLDVVKPPIRKFNPIWFYSIFILTLGLMVWGFYSSLTASQGIEIIARNQLEEIKENQITKAYYEHSSEKFKEKTSLEAFRKFIDNNPGLAEFKKVVFEDSQQENNYGVVFGELYVLDDISIPIKYEFVKEDSEWRILRIELDAPQMIMPGMDVSHNEITSSVKKHLEEIKGGGISGAYNDFGSDEFKSSTSFEVFKKFINRYPYFNDFEDLDLLTTENADQMAKVTAVLYSGGSILPLEYTLINQDGEWKVWSMQVLKSPLTGNHATKDQDEMLYKPIDSFLDALKDGNVSRAYHLTSLKFQKTTSFETFETFVSRFPILQDNEHDYLQTIQESNVGQVRVKLEDNDASSVIDYTLAKENEDWKILGIEIVEKTIAKPIVAKDDDEFNQDSLTSIINSQLIQIRSKDLFKAYEEYSSNEFKQVTSFETFAVFVDQNSIFFDNISISFDDLTFNNNVATLKGILEARNGDTAVVEYDLVKENDSWKVLGIKILSNEKMNQEGVENQLSLSPLKLEKVIIGTEMSREGVIKYPTDVIASVDNDIFSTLVVSNGSIGQKIYVILEHINSGSALYPMAATVEQQGDSSVTIMFSPPESGWPKGEYLLKVRPPSGKEESVPFQIRG